MDGARRIQTFTMDLHLTQGTPAVIRIHPFLRTALPLKRAFDARRATAAFGTLASTELDLLGLPRWRAA